MLFEVLILGAAGYIASEAADRWWWSRWAYSNVDHRWKFMEHYHWGIALCGLAAVAPYPPMQAALLGAGFGFAHGEAGQIKAFAIGAEHFKKSTIVGVTMLAGFALLYLGVKIV